MHLAGRDQASSALRTSPAAARTPVPICHVQLLPLMSGVQRAMIGMLEALDRQLFAPHVVCKEPGPMSEELARLEIPCHFVPTLERSIAPYRDWQAYRRLTTLFREQAFQIVHTHSSKPGVVGRLAARKAGVPHVLHHVQGFAFHEYSPAWETAIYKGIESYMAKHCDRLIFVNDEERRDVIDWGWMPADRCHTVYNSADLVHFHPRHRRTSGRQFRERVGLTADEFVICVVGRFDAQKQPLILPKIATALEALLGDRVPWKLLVVGAGSLEEKLRTAIAEARMDHRITILGWQRKPEDIFHASDVMLLPSLWEGLPLTLLEAASAGLPIVASEIKGNRECVTPDTGFLIPPSDPRAYAWALSVLAQHPDLAASMSRNARQRAESLFDAVQNNGQIAELYHRLLGFDPPRVPGLRIAA